MFSAITLRVNLKQNQPSACSSSKYPLNTVTDEDLGQMDGRYTQLSLRDVDHNKADNQATSRSNYRLENSPIK